MMTGPYAIILFNSLRSSVILSLSSENAWFAALLFGGYNMVLATVLAFAGSTVGMSINFGIGYYLSRWRDEFPVYTEERFQKGVRLFHEKLYLIMAIPMLPAMEMIPGLSFMPFFILVNGLFRVPPKKALCAIAAGRVLYYLYFLWRS